MPIFMKLEGVDGGSSVTRDSFDFTTEPQPEAGRTPIKVFVAPSTPSFDAADEGSDYSAIVFVGGWGASSYQYAYNDPSPVADDVVVDGRIITAEDWG